jgi:nucleoside-diphosphate-sugar epimerase
VDVDDVVKAMILLMESDIKNERFIVISENLSFKEFQQQTALALNVKPALKEASAFILAVGWRLDWLNQVLTGKRRRLSRHMVKSAKSITQYDASKLKDALNFKFKPMSISLKENAQLFLSDLEKNPY